jgi:NAD(P)-dependent dehydrogenase (short-subunit alcohol dehydrogenase family)
MFEDRDVIVTGGTGALGIAVVGALLAAGGRCHVPVAVEAEARSFPYRADSRVSLTMVSDLADEKAVAGVYAGLPRLWASIHLVGGFNAGPVVDTSKEDIQKLLDMNVMTTILCCRAAVKAMDEHGGRIVNVAARPALEWRQGAKMAVYTASKAAVAAFTVALAEEVAMMGILVNAVAPSIMDTPSNRKSMPKADFSAWPKVEEVARTIVFLASPDNAVTRGAVVPVYGRA